MTIKLSNYKFSPTVWAIIVGLILLRIGTMMSQPFLAIFLHFKAGVSLSLTGLIVGTSYLSYVIGGFFGGVLSDYYGRRNILCISLALYALTFFGFGMSSSLTKSPLILAFLFWIINLIGGLFRIWSETLGQAMLSDLTLPEQRVTVFSFRYTAINIGGAIGPLLGTVLGFSGNMAGFYFTGVMCFIYFLLFLFISRQVVVKTCPTTRLENITLPTVAKTLLQDKSLMYFIIGGIFAYLVYAQQDTILGQIMMQRFSNSHLFAIVLAINAIIVVCLQIPCTTYFMQGKRFTPLSLMELGCIFLSVGLIGFAFSGLHSVMYIVSQFLFTIGEIFIFPTIGIFIDNIAPLKLRGAYFGTTGFQFLGKAIGPALGGLMLQFFSGTTVLNIFAVVALATIFFYHRGGKIAQVTIKDKEKICELTS